MTDEPPTNDPWTPVVYDTLRELAQWFFHAEPAGHTLQPTALVHEAYLRLADAELDLDDRTRFHALAATVMRRVLVDSARARNADKRGGARLRVDLDHTNPPATDLPGPDVLELDDALNALAREHQRSARVVALRFFGGLTVDAVASLLAVSPRTVELDWQYARAWLARHLGNATP